MEGYRELYWSWQWNDGKNKWIYEEASRNRARIFKIAAKTGEKSSRWTQSKESRQEFHCLFSRFWKVVWFTMIINHDYNIGHFIGDGLQF